MLNMIMKIKTLQNIPKEFTIERKYEFVNNRIYL
ncbi:hypothetical protein CLPUN_44820 [Clostridium puniceum]|uniref:Uncharacterized protein n=1 Tax=Clostridium puniceum TaxID=29367 RepID=A0A1S8T755_9CLOT|nr:hypothetical protein CLPUN_44820 [Clostridium puniceum]